MEQGTTSVQQGSTNDDLSKPQRPLWSSAQAVCGQAQHIAVEHRRLAFLVLEIQIVAHSDLRSQNKVPSNQLLITAYIQETQICLTREVQTIACPIFRAYFKAPPTQECKPQSCILLADSLWTRTVTPPYIWGITWSLVQAQNPNSGTIWTGNIPYGSTWSVMVVGPVCSIASSLTRQEFNQQSNSDSKQR